MLESESESELVLDMDELTSAEDFLDYFEIGYDPSVVHVNRLHILQRFHDYIEQAGELPENEDELREVYRGLLSSAYEDFVNSDALTEKVFRVFHMNEPQEVFVPIDELKL
ncbi:MAG: nitrogenase-stabilizing/protective protein NifW [Gammaproteobacteria bacterium]|jgi:nitrogenase-stabilizing/protective protein